MMEPLRLMCRYWSKVRQVAEILLDFCVASIDDLGARLRATKQQQRCLIASWQRRGVPSRMTTQPRAPRGRVAHAHKNVAVSASVARGPVTSCGAAASYLN